MSSLTRALGTCLSIYLTQLGPKYINEVHEIWKSGRPTTYKTLWIILFHFRFKMAAF